MEKPLFAVAAGFAALIVLAAPAAAQTVTPASAAKSVAILGGPSALAAILAQQSGSALPQPASAPALTVLPALGATFSRAPLPSMPAPVSADQPDVFGTVALSIGRSPLDARWRRVERGQVGGSAAEFAAGLRDLPPMIRLEAVNRYVNRHLRFLDDSLHWGRLDVWTPAADTLRSGLGDCEDYAIAKFALLRAAGLAERDLYLVVVKDLVRRADHAVLVVRYGDRFWLLDNGTEAVTDAGSMQDYRPVLSFSGGRVWTHGYRVAPVLRVAAAPAAPATVRTASLGWVFSAAQGASTPR